MEIDSGVLRHVDPREHIAFEQIDVAVVEVNHIGDEIPLESLGMVMIGVGDHLIDRNLEDQLGRFNRGSTLPAVHLTWIAGCRHRSWSEIGGNEDGVAIDPGDG